MQNDSSLIIARNLLPKMPDDVFNIYIAPLVEAHGWPFDANGLPTNPAEARRWFQMFDLQDVHTIRQLSWKRREFPLGSAIFHPRSYEVVAALVKWHIDGVNTFITNIADSRIKFFAARTYIEKTGTLPSPVVLQLDPQGFRILDGNHRIAALASFSNTGNAPVDAWVGAFEN